MATRTWNANAGTYSFLDETNPPWASGVPAVSGDTIDLTTAYTPASDRPAAGTFSFSVAAALTLALQDWLAGASCGAVTVNHASAVVTVPTIITGALAATAGETIAYAESGPVTVTGLTTVGGTLTINVSGTFVANGGVTLAGGTLSILGSYALDSASVVLVTANSTVTGGDNGPVIYGGFNAQTYTVTWNIDANGMSVICDQAGTLKLGAASTPSLIVQILAATTLGADMSLQEMQVSAELTSANRTVALTVGSWNDGADLASGSTLNLTLNDGADFSKSGGIVTGTLNVTVPFGATVTAFQWNDASYPISTLTVAGALPTGASSVKVVAVTGTLTLAGTLDVQTSLTLTSGTVAVGGYTLDLNSTTGMTGSGTVTMQDGGVIAGVVNMTACTWTVLEGYYGTVTIDRAGTLKLGGSAAAIDLIINASGTVTLGAAETVHSFTRTSGVLSGTRLYTVGVGGATITGANSLGGLSLALGGNLTLTGTTCALGTLTVTASADITVDGTGATAVTSTSASIVPNGHTVTVSNVAANASNPINAVGCTDGGGNGAGVIFTATATKKKSRRFGRLMGVRAA